MAIRLKALVREINEVPEPFRELYTQTADGWVLDADDTPFKSKLDEFRNNNINLKQQQEAMQSQLEKYKDIDPEKYREAKQALDVLNNLEEKDLIKGGKIDEVIERRLDAARKGFEGQLRDLQARREALEQENGSLRDNYGSLLVDTHISKLVQNVGAPRKGAMDDILNRARRVWKPSPDGSNRLIAEGLYDSEGRPMTPETWTKSLLQEAPYLFEPSGGSGAGGGQRKTGRRDDGPKVINGSDPVEFGRNLRDIASGRVVVSSPDRVAGNDFDEE